MFCILESVQLYKIIFTFAEKLINMAKTKFSSYQQALDFVNTLPIQSIVEGYARLLYDTQVDKPDAIKITEQQFRTMFRIVGKTQDGEVERRGRKPKNT